MPAHKSIANVPALVGHVCTSSACKRDGRQRIAAAEGATILAVQPSAHRHRIGLAQRHCAGAPTSSRSSASTLDAINQSTFAFQQADLDTMIEQVAKFLVGSIFGPRDPRLGRKPPCNDSQPGHTSSLQFSQQAAGVAAFASAAKSTLVIRGTVRSLMNAIVCPNAARHPQLRLRGTFKGSVED